MNVHAHTHTVSIATDLHEAILLQTFTQIHPGRSPSDAKSTAGQDKGKKKEKSQDNFSQRLEERTGGMSETIQEVGDRSR